MKQKKVYVSKLLEKNKSIVKKNRSCYLKKKKKYSLLRMRYAPIERVKILKIGAIV